MSILAGMLIAFKDQNLRVSDEEIGQFAEDDTIVQLTDGTGYFVTIAFYHGLHCVRRLHHYIYKDHYYGNLTERESFMLQRHAGMLTLPGLTLNFFFLRRLIKIIEHCLDWLRQYLQCNVDPTIIPIRWDSGYVYPTVNYHFID